MCVCVCVCANKQVAGTLSHAQLFVTPWTVAHQAPLSMEFSRQEYWSSLPFSAPGDLSDLGMEPMSLACPSLAGEFFTTALPGKPSSIDFELS